MNTPSEGTITHSAALDRAFNAANQYQAALSAYSSGRYTEAMAMLDLLLQSQPFDADSHHLRGLIAFALKQNQEALHWIRSAVAIQPCAATFNTLCVVHTACRDYESAIYSAQQGLTLQADSAVLHYNMGLAMQLLGRLGEAATCYRSAIRFAPEHCAAHNNLGIVLKTFDQLNEAEHHFRHAVSANPDNCEARSNLGHVLLKMGHFTEAWPYF
ncbi:hypothetical protein BN2475_710057 [Paraburkholderia ribeironis]|uniref:Uncharacterized protein n=1 Tax=Paraburkholderia ribeironis TaxID=1247936 RepID=A0A1N7SI94_9BURK|nr:tetratricopeptide repeat protein [Paraburkholderia ribeironis]SIT47107.1 hypothetical protein BN2475_710057 [Paraburkholderia ribeironis]